MLTKSSSSYNEYGIKSFAELQLATQKIMSIPDEAVVSAISEAFGCLKQIAQYDPQLVNFLEDEENHRRIIETILRRRRQNLNEIIVDKCKKLNIA